MSMTRELIEIANRHESETGNKLVHLNSMMGVNRYVKDAITIKKTIAPDARVLDLGSGYGHMSYLLSRMGFKVVSMDILPESPYFVNYYNKKYTGEHIDYYCYNILENEKYPVLSNRQFDAILISGVLEHVTDFSLFLTRLKSLLKKNGELFIFRFPNRYSWIEKINDVLLGETIIHPLRFSLKEIHFMLRWHGFRVTECGYEQIFPVNFAGWPNALSYLYHRLDLLLMAVNRMMCRIPVLNKVSTSFWLSCKKSV